jgi:hypothetical protein
LTLFERADRSHGLPVYHLFGRFDHGIHEHEEDLATWNEKRKCWMLHAHLATVVNYKLAVDRLNTLAGDFQALCYNCHGLKVVQVIGNNSKTRQRYRREVKCPTCKGKGVRGQDVQESFAI